MFTWASVLLKPFKPYLILGGLWLVSLGWAYWQGGEYYRDAARLEYTRQTEINRLSLEDALQKVAVLEAEAKTNENDLRELKAQAAKDVDAKRIALPARSVQRIHRATQGRP